MIVKKAVITIYEMQWRHLPVQTIYNDDGTYSGPVGQSSWYGDIRNPIGRPQ